jgi:hypothetical protein
MERPGWHLSSYVLLQELDIGDELTPQHELVSHLVEGRCPPVCRQIFEASAGVPRRTRSRELVLIAIGAQDLDRDSLLLRCDRQRVCLFASRTTCTPDANRLGSQPRMQLWQHGLAEIREDVALPKESRDRDPREIIENRPLVRIGIETGAIGVHPIQAELSDSTAHALANLMPDLAVSVPTKLKARQSPPKKVDAFGVLHLFPKVADQLHRARLRTRFSLAIGKHEADGDARAKIVKSVLEHGVAVKVDFQTVWRLQESVTLRRKQLRDSSDGGWCVTLHVSSLLSPVVLELPLRSAKSVAKRDVDVFVSMVFWTLVADDDLLSGNCDVDAHAIQHSVLRMAVGRLDHHVTMGDGLVELLEAGGAVLDPRFDGRRRLHVFEGNSDRLLHTIPPLLRRHAVRAATPPQGANSVPSISRETGPMPAQILRLLLAQALTVHQRATASTPQLHLK